MIDSAISNAHAKLTFDRISLHEQNCASEFVSSASAALAIIPPAVNNPQLRYDRFPNGCSGTLNYSLNFGDVARMMHDAAGKPSIEMTKFNGNLMIYSTFMNTFETTTETIEYDLKRKLYLIQYCGSKVKSLIE